MTDQNQNIGKVSSMPKFQPNGSLPKLPAFKPKAPANRAPSVIVPALLQSSSQLPEVASISIDDFGEEEGGSTQAIAQPSQEDLEAAIAAMKNGTFEMPGTGVPSADKVGGAPSPVMGSAPMVDEPQAMVPSVSEEVPASVESVPSMSSPSLGPSPIMESVMPPAPISSHLAPKAGGMPAPIGNFASPKGADAPRKAPMPSLSIFDPVIPSAAKGNGPKPSLASSPVIHQPSPSAVPVSNSPVPGPVSPMSSAPSLGSIDELESQSAPLPVASPVMAPVSAPVSAPAASPAALVSGIAPVAVINDDLLDGLDDGPVFGGAAAENSELQFEDEDPDDAGEKTMMLDEVADDDLDDIGGEKTQISVQAMEFDPLAGKLIVESGKTNQREYILVREKTSIGRAPENDITISDLAMSRHHMEIDKFPEGFRVRDLESGNGTILNGYRIRVGQLRTGDIIEVGGIRFRFEQSGGDPDELWKGDPKVEYHPNQKGIKSTYNGPNAPNQGGVPSPVDAPVSSGPAMPPPRPSAPSGQQFVAQPPSVPPQQMNTMLQRQNGGIAAPQWNAAAPMTSPYLMNYGANALRPTYSTPIWANIVLGALFFLCIGSIIWFIIAKSNLDDKREEIAAHNAVVEKISASFTSSITAYSDARFEDAIHDLNAAIEADKDGDIIDKSLFDAYKKRFAQEQDVNNEIKNIRERTYNASASQTKVEEFEEGLKYLRDIPDDSVNKKWAKIIEGKVLEGLKDKLVSEIRLKSKSDDLEQAKALLDKLKVLPDTDADVKTLRKNIADKEAAKR